MFNIRVYKISYHWITLFILLTAFKQLSPVTSYPNSSFSKKFCVTIFNTLRARHKSCLLRPDTGPCRADVLQWYFDAQQGKCYRFYWGGCQGNGNRFDTKEACNGYCYLNISSVKSQVPHFCHLAFDYGSCFGHYNRWYWDNTYQACKRRIYSGCGGNQNNFQSYTECWATCVTIPNNTLDGYTQFTTCLPLNIPQLQKR